MQDLYNHHWRDLISKVKNIVVLTGAGVSAESGVKTFRDNNGLWENHPIEDVATPEGFKRNPRLVYDFYNARRRQLLDPMVKPNPAHHALARLEQEFNGNVLLVTQNVDNLHERAGSSKILHMHGDLLSSRCEGSGRVDRIDRDFGQDDVCHCCTPGQRIRPNIVWFGEMPMYMDDIYSALASADLFISIGTSGNVYPAAGFVEEARFHGAHTVELNLEPSRGQNLFAEKRYGQASELVTQFVDEVLAK